MKSTFIETYGNHILVVFMAFMTSLLIQSQIASLLPALWMQMDWNLLSFMPTFPRSNNYDALAAELKSLKEKTNKLQDHVLNLLPTEQKEMNRFTMSDFESYLRLLPLDEYEIHPSAKKVLKYYKVENDPAYLDNQEQFDQLIEEYGPFIHRPSSKDERFYVQWNNEKEEYSLYARIPIPYGVVLGYFTGILTAESNDLKDAWRYKAEIRNENGELVVLNIDSKYKGNWFHFLRLREEANAETVLLPFDNMWYILFKTTKPIGANEEIALPLSVYGH